MRLRQPRIEPVADDDLDADQSAAMEAATLGRAPLNIYRTLVRHPKALTRFLPWAGYIFSRRNTLAARERELIILRIGFLCRSGYEFSQHTRIGKGAGLTDADIAAIKEGPRSPRWDDGDRMLLAACDELHADQFISDPTWAALRESLSERQCMDLVFTAGQYVQVSMFLNTFGVQLDEGVAPDPDLVAT
jgi:alkylhydroperoxidase family enzyme